MPPGGCETGGEGGKINRNYLRLISGLCLGKFKMAPGDEISNLAMEYFPIFSIQLD